MELTGGDGVVVGGRRSVGTDGDVPAPDLPLGVRVNYGICHRPLILAVDRGAGDPVNPAVGRGQER